MEFSFKEQKELEKKFGSNWRNYFREPTKEEIELEREIRESDERCAIARDANQQEEFRLHCKNHPITFNVIIGAICGLLFAILLIYGFGKLFLNW